MCIRDRVCPLIDAQEYHDQRRQVAGLHAPFHAPQCQFLVARLQVCQKHVQFPAQFLSRYATVARKEAAQVAVAPQHAFHRADHAREFPVDGAVSYTHLSRR